MKLNKTKVIITYLLLIFSFSAFSDSTHESSEAAVQKTDGKITGNQFFDKSKAKSYPSFKSVYRNFHAIRDFKNKSLSKSLNGFSKSLADSPEYSIFQFNMASNIEAIGDKEEALKEYEIIINSSKDPQVVFVALYNKARLLAEMDEIDNALETYQKALFLNPQSLEIKTNIELLLTQSNGKGSGKGKKSKDKSDSEKSEGQQSDPGDSESEDQEPEQGKGDQKGDQEQEENSKDGSSDNKDPDKENSESGEGQKLNSEKVERILEELKDQERKVRARMGEKGKKLKEVPNGKDW